MRSHDSSEPTIVETSLMPGAADAAAPVPTLCLSTVISMEGLLLEDRPSVLKKNGFFNLPTEIRDIVYDYIIGTIRVNDIAANLPLPCTHVQEPLPFAGNTSLLCISRLFKDELLERYYRKHTVRIVLEMSEIYTVDNVVTSMALPTRADWHLMRKLDITIIRDRHDSGTTCIYCGLREQPTYRSEFSHDPCLLRHFTSGLRNWPAPAVAAAGSQPYTYPYPCFRRGRLATPRLRELAVRFASSAGYHDYKDFAGRIRTITHFLRELGTVSANGFSVAFHYGRGSRSASAEMDYVQLKGRGVIEARNPGTHLRFEPVLPRFAFVQALLDQGWGYEEVNYRLYGDRLKEQGRELLLSMDRAVLPRNLDGWICPWSGRDVKIRAIEVWGVYRWWLRDDGEAPRW